MGFYIETKTSTNKAENLVNDYNGTIISKPKSFDQIPEDKALIVVIDNNFFEAAGYAFDEKEFQAFTEPSDPRFKQFVLMDKQKAQESSGYSN